MAIYRRSQLYSLDAVSWPRLTVPDHPRPKTPPYRVARASRLAKGDLFMALQSLLRPFAPLRDFWSLTARCTSDSSRSGFPLHAVTRLLRPELHHYYRLICHLTSTSISSRLLMGAPCRQGLMQGFPSYHRLPVSSPILKHAAGLTEYRTSPYFAGLPPLPRRIRFAYAMCRSLPMASFRPHRYQ